MSDRIRNVSVIVTVGILFFAHSLLSWFGGDKAYSQSERRPLAQFPKLSAKQVAQGEFLEEFEDYSADQFPMREELRAVKAASSFALFGRLDNNGLYQREGYLSMLEYPLKPAMISHAATRFQWINDNYLREAGIRPYFAIVPDKNYFLAKKYGYPALDYGGLTEEMKARLDGFSYIDIFPCLSLEDYYRTDTHWRQECIQDVARRIASEMGVSLSAQYDRRTLTQPFYGVYAGQMGLPAKPDQLCYLTNDILEKCTVTSFDNGKPEKKTVYDMEKAEGKDPYDLFLGGADPLVMIENPSASTDRELVIFRDSFGSSLAPLLAEGYRKMTLVDIRYIQSSMIGEFIHFDKQDVLFLYSTLVLNSSTGLK